MAEQKTSEQLLTEWWAGRPDFSWKRLSRRFVGGRGGNLYGDRTLQDYWRRDPETQKVRTDEELIAAGELVEAPGGELWHIVHLPIEIKEHGQTIKANFGAEVWSNINRVLELRLREAKPETDSKDGRACLNGAVLVNLPAGRPRGDAAKEKREPLFLTIRHSIFLGPNDLDKVVFGKDADFSECCFAASAWFDDALFEGDVTFATAMFLGDTRFSNATFEAEARFLKVTMLFGANFRDAKFKKLANFSRIRSHGGIDFEDAQFKNAFFKQAEFLGSADFQGGRFEADALFDDANFAEIAWFNRRVFRGKASFERACFSKVVAFTEAAFGGQTEFVQTKFKGWTGFGEGKCLPIADEGEGPKISFYKAEFADVVQFSKFNFCDAQNVSFTSVRFLGPTLFSNTRWPENSAVYGSAFTDALFTRVAYFDNSDSFGAFAAFDGATFQDEVRFSSSVVETNRHLTCALRATWAGARQDAKELIDKELASRRKQNPKAQIGAAERARIGKLRTQANDRLAELQNGFRAVKHAVENRRERSAEQQFYRCELICRRKQSTTGLPERFFSIAYAVIADYGGSALRPLISVLLLWMTCSAGYWWWGEATNGTLAMHLPLDASRPVSESLFEAARFSAAAVFRPFGVWGDVSYINGWAAEFLGAHGAGHSLMVRLAASLQSIGALILFFLVALAVRRRFQIN